MNSIASQTRSWWQQLRGKSVLLTGAAMIAGAGLFIFLIQGGQIRAAVTITIAVLFLALALFRIQAAVIATLVYLVLMGDLRRLLIPAVGWSGTDPLLLIGPAFVIALFGYAVAAKSIELDTPMARWVAGLMAIMVLQIFNPRQGPLIVGVAGVLFKMVPLIWFWIGRTYATPGFMRTLLFKVVVGLAFLASLMGLYQNFYGYLPYQMEWYNIAGYTALGVPENGLAPISFFTSSGEYGVFLIIACVLLWAVVLRKKQYGALFLIPLFFVAAFLTGTRGHIAKVLMVSVGLWGVLGKSKAAWIGRGAVALVIGVAGLVWGLSQASQLEADKNIQYKIDRQARGLLNPADREKSTAGTHLGMMLYGYKRSLQKPLGLGLGATSLAATKFGGSYGGSTEVDSSDVFLTTGLFGGLIYLVIIFLVVRSTFRYWNRTRGLLAMGILGLLGVTFFLWLGGGQYAVSPLIWITIGALDRFQNKEGR